MKRKMKWLIAVVLTITVIGVAKLEEAGIIEQSITQYVTTGKDFVVMKKWVASLLNDPNNETIPVMGDLHEETVFANYESMQPYKDGVIVSYAYPIPIEAAGDGLIIFTGFTRESGKTVTVMYDDGDEVTYGYVGDFMRLPYTTVKKGDTLALMGEGAIYLMVKRNGEKLDASLLPAYLSGESEQGSKK